MLSGPAELPWWQRANSFTNKGVGRGGWAQLEIITQPLARGWEKRVGQEGHT